MTKDMRTHNDFVTLSAYTPSTQGGQRITVACPDDDRLARWVTEGFAHMPHDAERLPHRADVCQGGE